MNKNMNKNMKHQAGEKRDSFYGVKNSAVERLVPYGEEEIAEIWRLLDKRGNTRSKLVVALVEDVGLRMSEICQLRVADIDLNTQRVFLRSRKSSYGRSLPFGDRVRAYLSLWFRERRCDCGHDFLLHDSKGRPCADYRVRQELARTLCRTAHGKTVTEDGLERFSWYRLRLAGLRR